MAHYEVDSNTLIAENIFVTIENREILKGVTIRAEKGKITGLLGRNGSGKSTMLKTIFGTQKAQDSTIFINGKPAKQPFTKKGIINYLPQKAFLPPSLGMNSILKQFGISNEGIFNYFPELEKDLNKRVFELSGGMERLWSAIIIILADTRFTLLDEPFSHVMPLHVERLAELLVKQKEKKGIIITDHIYRPVLELCDSIYLMKEGNSIFLRHKEDLSLHGYLKPLE